MEDLKWQGYLRQDGRLGIRNRVLVIYTVKCAEFVAQRIVQEANHPDVAFDTLAIVGGHHGETCAYPVSPCGSCRQVMAEYQKKFRRPLQVILAGEKRIRKHL